MLFPLCKKKKQHAKIYNEHINPEVTLLSFTELRLASSAVNLSQQALLKQKNTQGGTNQTHPSDLL